MAGRRLCATTLALAVVACSPVPQAGRPEPATAAATAAPTSGPATSPAARFDYGMAFDARSGRAVMFGGFLSQTPAPIWTNETWSYEVATKRWELMRPATAPSPRHYPGMVYDEKADRMILFGGALPQGKLSNETWTYDVDTDTWSEMRPAAAPSPRSSWSGMIYDPVGDRVILHGGWTGRENASDLWVYDLKKNTWTMLADGPRSGQSLAYDPVIHRVVAFGGSPVPGSRSAGTWSFAPGPDSWSEVSTSRAPSPRSSPMQYAASVRKIVLFGGSTATGELAETWTYDVATNAWAQRHPDPAPSARHGFKLVYDRTSKMLLLFGGGIGSKPLDDMWSYDAEQDRWTRLH